MTTRSLWLSRVLAALFVSSLAVPTLNADTVVLSNGDRLTGTALKLEGGKLAFKTAWADAIAIDWKQVTQLETDKPLVLPLPQQSLSATRLERTPSGWTVTTGKGTETLETAVVGVLRSAADQKAYEASLHPGWGHAWAGAVNTSLALTRGNSQTATFGTGLALARETRTDKTSLYANTVYSRDDKASLTTANSAAGGLRYDHNLNPHLFAFGTADFASDGLQNLDLRSILGGGFGWHAVRTPRQTLDVLGGLVWTREHYSKSAQAAAATNSFAALDLGEQFSRKIGGFSLLTEQLMVYPDLNQTGQYQLGFTSAFTTRLGKWFNWQTGFADTYTSFPPAGTRSNDIVLTTGLGVTLVRK